MQNPKIYLTNSSKGFEAFFICPKDRNRISIEGKEKEGTLKRSLVIVKKLGFSGSKILDMTK